MIPLKLTIKNFLSYGSPEQTIDFTPYHLICLSGKNGHGKSALLDAMTWALWGQARKMSSSSKPDDALLHLGQTFMTVTFDFECNNTVYRVRREYGRTFARPYASLDFGMINPQTNAFVALTDKTIRGTQATIDQTIGISYEAFINSAFLRQGHANEFSTKSPQDRKEILASILQLDTYEALRKKAQDTFREIAASIKHIKAIQINIQEKLATGQQVVNALTNLETELNHVHMQEQEQQNERLIVTQKKELAAKQLHIACTLQDAYEQSTQELTQHKTVMLELFTTWRRQQKIRLQVANLEQLEQQRAEILQAMHVAHQEQQELLLHKERILKINKAQHEYQAAQQLIAQQKNQEYERAYHYVHTQLQTIQAQLSQEIQAHITINQDIVRLAQEQEELQASRVQLDQKLQNIEGIEKQFEKRKNFYHQWVAQAKALQQEQLQLAHKQGLTHDETNPSCPLCQQNLSATRKKFLKNKFQEQQHFIQHQLNRLAQATTALKRILLNQHEELKELRIVQEQRTITIERLTICSQAQIAVTTKQKIAEEKIKQLQVDCATVEHQCMQAKKALEHAVNEYETQKKNDPQLALWTKELSFLEDSISNTMAKQKDITYLQTQLAAIEQVQKQISCRDQLLQAFAKARQLRAKNKELTMQCMAAQIAVENNKNVVEQETILFQKEQKTRQRKEQLLQDRGQLVNQQAHITTLTQELATYTADITSQEQELFEYEAIAQALGKNGIQALLIEEAIPEIEQEANILLAQLTDNQTHIMIESLKDLKKGGVQETLDIKISDPMGIRPYELFSGGEAFRIDVALRIAIAKLLARRAGTSLQTLIIDEGFGSQDEEGLARLMDIMYSIQDNFCKVIIVSHLPSMKSQFPIHFVVNKSSQGSTITVIDQG